MFGVPLLEMLRSFLYNWMFAKSVCGAEASALVYSITETALLNHLKSYVYLTYILDELRKIGVFSKEELKKLLPWSEQLPELLPD